MQRAPQARVAGDPTRPGVGDCRPVSADVVAALAARGGVARHADLARGLPRRALAEAVGRGVVTHLPGGVYLLPGTPRPLVTAAVHNSVLTCVSAAQHHGLAVLVPPEVPHVAVPRTRGATASLVREQFPAVRHRDDAAGRSARAVASVPDALARMLLCLPAAEALVGLDSALNMGRTTLAAVARALPAKAPAHRRLLLRLADGRAASPAETLARLALRGAGLRVKVGEPVTDVGFVDLLVEGRIVVELDGFAYHSGRREFEADRRRDRELVARGFVVLRFTYADVVRDARCVVRAVGAALSSHPAVHGQPLM